ncbi:hypothetical protein SBA1_140015 [Candidatus Sulfotelmatobacter kueseliae]|uniref:Uncharacterized protein n=1 Tax=Candidatus Sulfotelmatobacter kueseliae TaxID=2042962 RepID=A0A2U3K626_9BACT|nr:hypothetical protein SBA1_140015 [Candidatus Sulfotelmatobacter kueseliae]
MKKPDSRSQTCESVLGQHEPSARPEDSMCRRDGRMIFTLEEPHQTQAANLWEMAADPQTGSPSGKPTKLTNWCGINPCKARVSKDGKRRVTRKHSIKPAPVEAITAMRQLSETFSKVETPKLLLTNAPQTTQNDQQRAEGEWVQ